MATLALAAVGAAAGNALLPASMSFLGVTLSGAAIGGQIGALAGRYIDQSLLGASGSGRTFEGPRLSDLHVTSSTEGAPVPRVYGRARLGGQVVWATNYEEETVKGSAGGGGKGLGGGGGASTVEYRYYANFAVAICEGEISGIARIWADGNEMDLSAVTWRLYPGSETQFPDSLIEARDGAGNAPAYRGTAYVVFERLPLAVYGNRIPQLSFEVTRPVDDFAHQVRGVVLIPGSGEFVYATTPVAQRFFDADNATENAHTNQGPADLPVALDQLQTTLPGVTSVSLIVSWFGDDLRAGECRLRPGVEQSDKVTTPLQWSVAGLDRASAYLVSRREGRPAYGGTPSDETVVAAIAELRARGLSVTLTPFILMDVAPGNGLADPYGGGAQAAYPWRGRITVSPAAGQPASPDKSAAAAAQVSAFVGTATAADFHLSGTSVVYTGPAEWSFRRMVLHHAFLAKAAGGVDAFVIGSELRGLTTVRDGASSYPFVSALAALAGEVKSVLGAATKVLYAADWSEYFGHHPADGSGDLFFHLDPLWASPSIDAIGIDAYWPLADWREGVSHLDAQSGAASVYDLAYLRSNIAGGEGYDWYYASAADRDAQLRTPITDGAGKPWVWRYKDLRSWWLEPHFDRPGGVESAAPTAWVPQSKPFWLMEIGCPAVDNGANQPNVFVDPKSSESALPYYSRGVRDDLMQRQYLRALIGALDPVSPDHVPALNPVSAVTGGRMIEADRVHVYCWDARPYPAFPLDTATWGDGGNWRLGHWLNARLAGAPLPDLVSRILADFGFTTADASALVGTIPGFVVDRVMSAREAIQPLELACFFDSIETGGSIAFRHRGASLAVATLAAADLVEADSGSALLTLTRGQETELPASAKVTYIANTGDYRQAVAESRRLTGASGRVAEARIALVLDADQAGAIADTWLYEAWAARERASFALPPSLLAVEPGDLIELAGDSGSTLVRVTDVADHGARDIDALGIDPTVYVAGTGRDRPGSTTTPDPLVAPVAELVDLPIIETGAAPQAGYFAAALSPWPGSIALYGSPETSGYTLRALASAPATIGTTLVDLPAGPAGRIDRGTRLRLTVSGPLYSVSSMQLFAGQNAAAVRNADGEWEVLQFETATLVAPSTYELSGLLRGQLGTEGAMATTTPAGARFVLLDTALTRVDLSLSEVGLPLRWRYGPAGRDIASPSYVDQAHAFAGHGLRPYSPVHVRAARSGGDLGLTWIRRTRLGGDSWELPDVPLSEEAERYEVDILSGSTVKRTLAVSAPAATYTAVDQIADFGAVQSTVSLRIAQLSATFGRGSYASAVV